MKWITHFSMNTAEITSQQSAAGDGKQRGGFSKSVSRKKSGCIFKLVASHCLPPLSRSVVAGRSAPGNNRRVLPSAGCSALRASQPADAADDPVGKQVCLRSRS